MSHIHHSGNHGNLPATVVVQNYKFDYCRNAVSNKFDLSLYVMRLTSNDTYEHINDLKMN